MTLQNKLFGLVFAGIINNVNAVNLLNVASRSGLTSSTIATSASWVSSTSLAGDLGFSSANAPQAIDGAIS
jgi:hypothetical protein